jgi:predicted transcriptional regulator
MRKEKLNELVSDIKANDTTHSLTAREFINALGCEKRSSGNVWHINQYLSDNQLEVEPNYTDVWIDSTITLRHKKRATTKVPKDPIKKIMILEAANRQPITINNDAKIQEAVTIMMLKNYSQLPVVTGPRSLVGFISWETIGVALTNGEKSDCVKDYVNKNIKVVRPDMPLLEAIKSVYKHDFVVVIQSDNTISGIVTTADISSQYLTFTEPFFLLEQIENHIRQILDKKFLLEDLVSFCASDSHRTIERIDDLTFGEYIRLMENEKNWQKLKISIDRTIFLKELDKVREIRNDIMHFDPEGITDLQRKDLKNMAMLLNSLDKFSK